MKKIQDILKKCKVVSIHGDENSEINQVHFDSRKVETNDLFVAVKGTQVDGHSFIAKTIEQGATCVVCEELPEKLYEHVCYVKVEDSSFALGWIASNYYNNPSSDFKLVGITGTNGKTTTATLLYELFKGLGYKVGLISTVENYIHDKTVEATHTTPDPVQLNALMNNMVEAGCDYCFMEVSSHAIHQNRIAGLFFNGGVFTNLTHDHLDYHKTFDEYLNAKKMFFDGLDANTFALTNADDRNGKIMLQNTKATKYTYALRTMADYKCKVLESHFDGMQLTLDGIDLWSRFIGKFNAYNITAIYSTAVLLDQDKQEVLTILSTLESVNGRFEAIRSENGITAIVDYAHTPDALKNVLNTINDINETGQIITVVGAGGDRDKSKRPDMAKIACNMSNKVILTSDNPRSEDPEEILADMMKGVDNLSKAVTIVNRKDAIKTACLMANPGDIILVAGKGHETYQEIKGVKHHFDDKEIINEIFKTS